MTEKEFKDAYIVTFLASWTAAHYTDYCLLGWQDRLNRPPVEDAIDLANSAWELYQTQTL